MPGLRSKVHLAIGRGEMVRNFCVSDRYGQIVTQGAFSDPGLGPQMAGSTGIE